MLKMRKPRSRRAAEGKGLNVVRILIAIVILVPVLWMVNLSFRYPADVFALPLKWIPDVLTFEPYQKIFTPGFSQNWSRVFVNSITSALVIAVTVAVIGVTVGYSLARIQSRWVPRILGLVVLAQLFSGPAIVIPFYVLISGIGLADSIVGYTLVMIFFFLPLATLLGRNFASAVPIDIEEAALVDGCRPSQAFRKVYLPLAKVSLVTIGALVFLLAWGEYPMALALLRSGEEQTVAIALAELVSQLSVKWNEASAASILISLPAIMLLVVAQRLIVRGLTTGAVK